MSSGPKQPNDSILSGIGTPGEDPFEEDDGLGFSVEDFLPEEDTQKFIRKSPVSKTIDGVLGIFRLPEQGLAKLYEVSPIRWLLMKFEWYRDLADQRELGSIIEDTYGGPRGVLFRISRFFRQNVLFTCIMFAAFYLGGRQAMAVILDQDAVRTVLGVESFDAESKISEIKEARNAAEEILNRRVNLKEELNGCIVTAATRDLVLGAIGENGYLDDDSSLKAMSAVRRFRQRYEAAGFATAADDASTRIARTANGLLPSVDMARKKALEIKQVNARLRAGKQQIEAEVARLEAKGSTEILNVNKVIRAKDELDASHQLIVSGPSDIDIDALVARLDVLHRILTRSMSNDYPYIDVQEPRPEWYKGIVYGDADAATRAVERVVTLGFEKFTNEFANESRPLVGDAVYSLSDLVDKAISAIHEIELAPAVALDALAKEEQSINGQIDRVLGTQSGYWVDHRPCLARDGVAIDVSVLE